MAQENPVRFQGPDGTSVTLDTNPDAFVEDIIFWVRDVFNIPEARPVSLFCNKVELDGSAIFGEVVEPNSCVLVKIPTKDDASSGQAKRPKRALPPRDGLVPDKDPDDFETKLTALMEIGEPLYEDQAELRRDCEKALRMAFYNVDRASMYVISKSIPDVLRSDVERNPESWRSQYPDKVAFVEGLIQQFSNLDESYVVQICIMCNFEEKECVAILENPSS